MPTLNELLDVDLSFQEILEQLEEETEDFDKKIISIVGDNTKTMELSKDKSKREHGNRKKILHQRRGSAIHERRPCR